jgi:hypothetical protein
MKTWSAYRVQLALALFFILVISSAHGADTGVSKLETPAASPNATKPLNQVEPCKANPSVVVPEYPLPAYSASKIVSMLKRPTNVIDLLLNLKVVFDQKLLAQPTFFSDEVLLKLVNGTDVRWLDPGDPEFSGDRLIRPTRIARVTTTGSNIEMTVDVGVNHECLDQHPTLDDPQILLPPHTYDSGFLRLKLTSADHSFTLGTVRRVFGPNPGRIDRTCKEPFPLSYPTTSRLGPTPFFWDTIAFHPQREGYAERCGASLSVELPDDEVVELALIRLLEDNHTLRVPDQP